MRASMTAELVFDGVEASSTKSIESQTQVAGKLAYLEKDKRLEIRNLVVGIVHYCTSFDPQGRVGSHEVAPRQPRSRSRSPTEQGMCLV